MRYNDISGTEKVGVTHNPLQNLSVHTLKNRHSTGGRKMSKLDGSQTLLTEEAP
jgi:hypothetical protein